MHNRPSFRYHSLDLWRGVACLIVLAHHSVFVRPENSSGQFWFTQMVTEVAARGWIGVPMFFVISGYCIAAAGDSARRKGNGAGTFFYRRVRRIFPPAWIVLLASVFMVVAIDVVLWPRLLSGTNVFFRPWWLSPSQWVGNLTLTESWRYHLAGDETKCMYLGHYWTLCFEEQFYLIVGLAAFLTPRQFFAVLGAVTCGSLIATVLAELYDWRIDGFFFYHGWLQFAVGVALFFVLHHRPQWRRLLLLAAAAMVAAIVAIYPQQLLETHKNWQQQHLAAFAFGALLVTAYPADQAVATAKWLRPLMACGVMCYSIYLVHLPICRVCSAVLTTIGDGNPPSPYLSLLLCVPTSLLVAWGFHIWVERRFMSAPSSTPAGQEILTGDTIPA